MKKKNMRSLVAILVILAVMVSFTGCQQSKTTADGAGVETKIGSTTYW